MLSIQKYQEWCQNLDFQTLLRTKTSATSEVDCNFSNAQRFISNDILQQQNINKFVLKLCFPITKDVDFENACINKQSKISPTQSD